MFQVNSCMIPNYYPVLSMDKIEFKWAASLVLRKNCNQKGKYRLFILIFLMDHIVGHNPGLLEWDQIHIIGSWNLNGATQT